MLLFSIFKKYIRQEPIFVPSIFNTPRIAPSFMKEHSKFEKSFPEYLLYFYFLKSIEDKDKRFSLQLLLLIKKTGAPNERTQ